MALHETHGDIRNARPFPFGGRGPRAGPCRGVLEEEGAWVSESSGLFHKFTLILIAENLHGTGNGVIIHDYGFREMSGLRDS